jgi:hypothetical protein
MLYWNAVLADLTENILTLGTIGTPSICLLWQCILFSKVISKVLLQRYHKTLTFILKSLPLHVWIYMGTFKCYISLVLFLVRYQVFAAVSLGDLPWFLYVLPVCYCDKCILCLIPIETLIHRCLARNVLTRV